MCVCGPNETQAMGCFVFPVHRHISRPLIEFQDIKLFPASHQGQAGKKPQTLSSAPGSNMWLVPTHLLRVGIPRMLSRIITRLSGQEGGLCKLD